MVNWEQEREMRYLSIKEVADVIKIPPIILTYFENGQVKLSDNLLELLIN